MEDPDIPDDVPPRDQFAPVYPVFALTKVPKDYFDEFDKKAREEEVFWTEMVSIKPDGVFDGLQANPNRDEQVPFSSYTHQQLYEFYKSHIRGQERAGEYFSDFTFVAIDEACVNARPRECLVFCDAPDLDENNEDDPSKPDVLKQLRLPFEVAMAYFLPLELLALTPSEVEKPGGMVMNVMPDPFFMPTDDLRIPGGLFAISRLATREEARSNKREALAFDSKKASYRAHTIVQVPIEECKKVSRVFRDSAAFRYKREERLRRGESPPEDIPLPALGVTGFFDGGLEQEMAIVYGDDVKHYTAHLKYRLAAYPGTSGPIKTYISQRSEDTG